MKVLEETLTKILKNSIEAMGYELYDLTYTKGPKRGKLTVYIDKNGGVSLKDCEIVSRHISVVLDVEDVIEESYTLEVSSPGINRALKTQKHFQDAIGKECVVHVFSPVLNKKSIHGILKSTNDDGIEIESDNCIVKIDFKNIRKANLNLI